MKNTLLIDAYSIIRISSLMKMKSESFGVVCDHATCQSGFNLMINCQFCEFCVISRLFIPFKLLTNAFELCLGRKSSLMDCIPDPKAIFESMILC